MKDLFIPYPLAKLAKEKGFNEQCFGVFDSQQEIIIDGGFKQNEHYNSVVAPLYQQIVSWFREEKRIIICVELDQTSDVKFVIELYKYLTIDELNSPEYSKQESRFEKLEVPLEKWGYYRDYNRALNVAIDQAFKFI